MPLIDWAIKNDLLNFVCCVRRNVLRRLKGLPQINDSFMMDRCLITDGPKAPHLQMLRAQTQSVENKFVPDSICRGQMKSDVPRSFKLCLPCQLFACGDFIQLVGKCS